VTIMPSTHDRMARSSTTSGGKERNRILPKSKADVEAALAAVRARTAKLKLLSPERTSSGTMGKATSELTSKADSWSRPSPMPVPVPTSAPVPVPISAPSPAPVKARTTTKTSTERRQPPPETRNDSSTKSATLDPSTLQSVSEFIGKLNSKHTLAKAKRKAPIPQPIPNYDSSSDESYGVSKANLDNINAMFDKVQNKKQNENQMQNQRQKPEIVQRHSSDSSDDNLPVHQNFDFINAFIDKVHTANHVKTGEDIVANVQSPKSDISNDDLSDDSSVGVGAVSAAQQANLAMYIDSLNSKTKPQSSNEMKKPLASDNFKESDAVQQNNVSNGINSAQKGRPQAPVYWQTMNPNIERNLPQKNPMVVQHITPSIPKITNIQKPAVQSKSLPNTTVVKKAPVYDEMKLKSFIEKAKEVAEKKSPKLVEVEYIIIYARRDGIPIKPILKAFDDCCKSHTNSYTIDNSSPTKGLFDTARTVSSDIGLLELDDDALDVFLNNKTKNSFNNNTPVVEKKSSKPKLVSIAHREIQGFVYYINEAVSMIERNIVNADAIFDLIDRATEEKFDDTLLREILNNPQKHVAYEEGLNDDVVVLTMEDSRSIEMEEIEKNKEDEGEENKEDEGETIKVEQSSSLKQEKLSEASLLWSNNSLNNKEQHDEVKAEDKVKEEDKKSKEIRFQEYANSREIEIGIVLTEDVKTQIKDDTEGQEVEFEGVEIGETANETEENIETTEVNENKVQENPESINVETNVTSNQVAIPNTGEEAQENAFFFGVGQQSEDSSVPSVGVTPEITTPVGSSSASASASASASTETATTPTVSEGNSFLLREDSSQSQSEERDLDNNERYLLQKIKQLDTAKLFATGKAGKARAKINKDGTRTLSTSAPPPLEPVKATKRLFSRRMLKDFPGIVPYSYLQQWKILPKDRIAGHPNYEGVHEKSLYDATEVTDIRDPIDKLSWEDRDVNQFFIRDVDLTKRANWFG
jgi:hypothetical protein